ncbi:hypothetical protein BT69DRAFT_1303194 [Atractiella rhizophila]|nr:hypothetical protein BT69DRAFT_1303194 [Atractiella rhizophila]
MTNPFTFPSNTAPSANPWLTGASINSISSIPSTSQAQSPATPSPSSSTFQHNPRVQELRGTFVRQAVSSLSHPPLQVLLLKLRLFQNTAVIEAVLMKIDAYCLAIQPSSRLCNVRSDELTNQPSNHFVLNKPAVRPADYAALERFSEADVVQREMANRVILIELRNLIQDVVDMQTNGYKVSDNLSVRTLFANHGVIKSPGFTHIPTVLKDNATVMKAVSKDVQRRCTKARNTIKTEIKESIEELQHIEDLTTHLHRFRLGTCARGVSQAEMMLVSMLRQFVKLDLELGSQGKKVTVKVTASKKRKRIDLLGERNDDDEEENLSLWDALDKELAAMSKMKHADRFTYATISARDLQLIRSPSNPCFGECDTLERARLRGRKETRPWRVVETQDGSIVRDPGGEGGERKRKRTTMSRRAAKPICPAFRTPEDATQGLILDSSVNWERATWAEHCDEIDKGILRPAVLTEVPGTARSTCRV